MIVYKSGFFGFSMLTRMHGSAVLRSTTPAILSTGIFLALFFTFHIDLKDEEWKAFDHPYVIGVVMAAFTFMLTFRANFAYGRYWEAATAVHQMQSKWIDIGIELSAFHLQSSRYKEISPPAFGEAPHANKVIKVDRKTHVHMSPTEMIELMDEVLQQTGPQSPAAKVLERTLSIKSSLVKSSSSQLKVADPESPPTTPTSAPASVRPSPIPTPPHEDEPSPFLVECTHLLSLLSAVALATLRNDMECVETPLGTFSPGSPWPPVDPDAFSPEIRQTFNQKSKTMTAVNYLLGRSRTDKQRTLYNAARPFRVLGGVSDGEMELLNKARGGLAKVALCKLWLEDFMSREYMAGSTGNVAPPIISRLYQYSSDGMLGYNQARKVAYIPFPFPHAQLTVVFIAIMVLTIPVLMLSYTDEVIVGSIMSFICVMCFTGLHEVALELESPFQNAPNDLPLNRFQAQFNEGLISVFCGYHPDAYWELPKGDLNLH